MTIEPVGVHILGGGIEVGTTTENAFPLASLALLPGVYLVLEYLVIERDDGERRDTRELV